MTKHQLILDVAGVLVTNMSPLYWKEIAELENATNKDLKIIFNKHVRELYWSGRLPEEAFWKWLHKECPSVEISVAKTLLTKHLQTLPAFERIPEWSQFADIHLLSNHREEWLVPILNSISSYIKTITISSRVGCCKPHAEIYEIVNSKLEIHSKVTFVDDHVKNLKAAQVLNWNTLIADQDGEWIDRVDDILGVRQ